MNSTVLKFSSALSRFALLSGVWFSIFISFPASAAQLWYGPLKIAGVERNIYGDLVIVLQQPLVTPCGSQIAVAAPKSPPNAGVSMPDATISGMEAIALTALTRNSDVVFAMESSWGCIWGAYPGIMTIRVNQ